MTHLLYLDGYTKRTITIKEVGVCMHIMLVGTVLAELELLEKIILYQYPECIIKRFINSNEALEYANHNFIDLCFASIKLSGISGIYLTKELKILNPYIRIVFIEDDDSYAMDAWNLHINAYIRRPITYANIIDAIEE